MTRTEVGGRRPGASLASPFLELLPVAGVAISVFNGDGAHSTIHSSDETASGLESLQFDLGEGPLYRSFATGEPVFVADCAAASADWPFLISEASALGIGSIYAFPLVMGAVCIGAAVAHSPTSNALSDISVETGCALGRAVAIPSLARAMLLAGEETIGEPEPPIELRRDVHQAIGMVLAQLDTTATDAFARIRAHAYATDRSVGQVATDVIARQLNFSLLSE